MWGIKLKECLMDTSDRSNIRINQASIHEDRSDKQENASREGWEDEK